MSYEQQTWDDNNPLFVLSAARMLHIEGGIKGEEIRALAAEASLKGETLAIVVSLEGQIVSAREAAEDASIPLTQKGNPNGVATLEAGGKIPSNQLPPGEIVETKTVKKESELIALEPTKTTIVIVTEPSEQAYIWNGGKTKSIADWTPLTFATGIQEINGKTGSSIHITAEDVNADIKGAAAAVETAATGKVNTERTRAEGAEATITAAVVTERGRAEGVEATKVSTTDARLTNERTPTNGSVTTEKIPNLAVTKEKLSAGVQAELAEKGSGGSNTVNVHTVTGNYTIPSSGTSALLMEVSANITPPAVSEAGKESECFIRFKQGAAGSHIPTLLNVNWSEGIAPEFTPTPGAIDYVVLISINGEPWDGFIPGKDWLL